MDINIDWQQPVQLTRHKKMLFDEDAIPQRILDKPGVYFFSRAFGDDALPFYIGESGSIRRRLGNHLRSTKIVFVLLGMDKESGIKGQA